MRVPRAQLRLLIAVVAALVVVAVVVLWPRSDAPAPQEQEGAQDLESCLATAAPDDAATACPDLGSRLAAQSPDAVDVLLLVPDSADPDAAVDTVTGALDTWKQRLDFDDGSGAGPGAIASTDVDLSVATLGPGAPYPLLDPEIVIVAALPPGETLDRAVDVYASDGSVCDRVAQPFDLDSWKERPEFNSHHRLPEGTYLEACGGAGGNVCFAVNGTFNPVADLSGVMEAIGLVNDELDHCLDVARGDSGGWGPDAGRR